MFASARAFRQVTAWPAARSLATKARTPAQEPSTFAKVAKVTFFGGLVGGTFCLGCWQSQRYSWKVALLEDRQAALRAPPLPLPEGATASTLVGEEPALAERCRRVRVRGTFDASRSVVVGPRSAPPGLMQQATGMGTGPQGYVVFTVRDLPLQAPRLPRPLSHPARSSGA